MTDQDMSTGIIYFSGRPKERQILSPEQAAAFFRVSWKDERTRLANPLAAGTGVPPFPGHGRPRDESDFRSALTRLRKEVKVLKTAV
jgi:hypothetical protein